MNGGRIAAWILCGTLGVQCLAESPGESSRGQARQLMAQGQYRAARTAYGEFLRQCPVDDPRAARATFERAQCLLMEGQTEEGVREMIALSQKYPECGDAPLALWVAVYYFLVEKPDKQQAWLYAEQILKKYPQHVLAQRVRETWPSIEKLSTAELLRQAKRLKAMAKPKKTVSSK